MWLVFLICLQHGQEEKYFKNAKTTLNIEIERGLQSSCALPELMFFSMFA